MNRSAQIKKLHNEVVSALRTSLPKAIRIGELLTAQKKEEGHGNWQPWMKDNLPFSIRTATNYMKLYDKREELKTANVADLAAAYQWLKTPDEVTVPLKMTEAKHEEWNEAIGQLLAHYEGECEIADLLLTLVKEKLKEFIDAETDSTASTDAA